MMAAPSLPRSQRELFGEIVERHGASLSRLCAGYERGAAQREELMQEILLALWRALPGFRGESSLRTWMYRVAHNVAVTHVARARRQPPTTTEAVEIAGEDDGPHESAEEAQRLERLRAAIQTLEPLNRQIILLYLEEIPQAEIAEITGLTTTNVATRVSRIKGALSRTLSAGSKR